jgi:eukaryotic-like serine/threonine-protein kinase
MLETGTVIQDRYRIVRLLGQGGMGSVYRAWDVRLKVPIALKELLPQPGLDEASLAALRDQFEQEAGVLARLNHPHLVRVTDFFEEGDKAYLVMDFVEGRSLADLIVQEGGQSESRVMGWARQLLEALDYCHTRGVVHRDIKPQNIILRLDGSVVLVDFGLVKLWDPNDPVTRTVMRGMGTPEYAPPEQYGATKDHTGPPSDIYSLGATLYHLLSGQSPPTATERMAMPEQFRPLRQIVPSVSVRAEQLVMKALSLSVSERWQSAREMLAVLASGPLQEPSQVEFPRTLIAPPSQRGTGTGQAPRTEYAPGTEYAPRTEYAPQAEYAPQTGGVSQPSQGFGEYGRAAPRATTKRSKGFWFGVVGAALLCIALSCGGYVLGRPALEGVFGPTSEPSPTVGAAVTATVGDPDSTPTVTGGQIQITLQNRSSYDVCYVFISPADSDSWGEDRLAADETIPQNGTRGFDMPAGSYDLLARACDEAVMATAWKVSTSLSLEISGANLVPLRVTNDIGRDLCYVFISPEVATDWGDDQLGEMEVLEDGQSRLFFVSRTTYDLMAQDCSGTTVSQKFAFPLQAESTWYLSDGAVAP